MASHSKYHHDTTQEVCVDIHDERMRQQALIDIGKIPWDMADPTIGNGMKIGVLGEEFGEVCKAVVESQSPQELYAELVQVAAVAVAWAESIPLEDRGV